VATPAAELDQVGVTPATARPAESKAEPDAFRESPGDSQAVAGVTRSDATSPGVEPPTGSSPQATATIAIDATHHGLVGRRANLEGRDRLIIATWDTVHGPLPWLAASLAIDDPSRAS
jgi:hypothetical protein